MVRVDGQFVYDQSDGMGDRQHLTQVQQQSLFRIASVTKPIVADGGIRYSGDITKALAAGARVTVLPAGPVSRRMARSSAARESRRSRSGSAAVASARSSTHGSRR